MAVRSSWLLGSLGTVIVLVQPAVLAKSVTEVNRIAWAITVQIATARGNGSGILLQRQDGVYTVLTAAHVVKDSTTSYTITTPDGQTYQPISGSIRRYAGDIDLAVLKFSSTATYELAKLGDSNVLEEGMELYVAGFPRGYSEPVSVFRLGQVLANSKRAFKNGYALLYNNSARLGMNGGPVLNTAGQVVGVNGPKFNVAGTGFNVAVPIARFADVAQSLGI
jgi:serine protease Do